MGESEKSKCLNCMDFSCSWSDWRQNLKQNITGDKHYYLRDEAVQHVAEQLNSLLDKAIVSRAPEEDLIRNMWDVASADERRSLAMVLLKLVENR